MITINIDWLFLTLIIFSWGYYFVFYTPAFLIKWCRKKKKIEKIDIKEYFISVMIPCRNEETVIQKTLENIEKLEFNKKTNYQNMEIVVINDGSTDNTQLIAESYNPKITLHILNVVKEISGKGKSEALNKGIDFIKNNSNFPKTNNHIVCVFDADGLPDLDLIEKMCDKFDDQKIGSINSSIRIYNRHTNFLSMMQDIEFNLISRYLNHVRGYLFMNSLMGGNGQFMRYTVLEDLHIQYGYVWKRSSLTEDLDIGMRILFQGWKTYHLFDGFVHQQGLIGLGSLIRQRNRWAWGTAQACFKYVLSTRLFRQSNVGFFTKIDLMISLLTPIIISTLVPFSITILILNLKDVIEIELYLPDFINWILVSLWVIFPLFLILKNKKDYILFYFLPHFIGYIIYNIVLLPTLIYGLLSVISCRIPTWSKTKRIGTFETQLISQIKLDNTTKTLHPTQSETNIEFIQPSPSMRKIFLIKPSPRSNVKGPDIAIDINSPSSHPPPRMICEINMIEESESEVSL